jgi:signal transduction histidine kinase
LSAGVRLRSAAATAGRDLVYVVAILGTSILAFTVVVTGISLTLSLLVFVIGVFVWMGTVYAFRWITWLERRLAGWARGERIEGLYREPQKPGPWDLLKTLTGDPQTWRDLAWMVINSFLGFALATVALTALAVVLAYVSLPIWWSYPADPDELYGIVNFGIWEVTSTAQAWIVCGAGLVLMPLALLLNRGVVGLHSGLAAKLLGPGRERELAERVDVLTRTRRGALDVQAAELRRIERDLHDGAQARLVSLSMQLGRAEARAEAGEDVTELLRGAHREADAAIAELRDLARGIAPPVLADRGLGPAIEALCGRVAIPATVTVEIAQRPLPVIETAAYFVAAEALTNVAKHAPDAEARIAVRQRDGVLEVEVRDDGPGGADPEGSGLGGLRSRVEALDGHLFVGSDPAGGTTVRAELPCEP